MTNCFFWGGLAGGACMDPGPCMVCVCGQLADRYAASRDLALGLPRF